MIKVFSANNYLLHLHASGIRSIPAHLVIETWDLDGMPALANLEDDTVMVKDVRGCVHCRHASDFISCDSWIPCSYEFEPAVHGYTFYRRLRGVE